MTAAMVTIVLNAINDTVTVGEPLANTVIAEFWYYSTGEGKR